MDILKIPKFTPSNSLLKGKEILITGAGSGIGREVALACSEFGANLILLSRNAKKLYSLQDQIVKNGHSEPLVVEFDFEKAKEKDYLNLFEKLCEEYEKLDGLVHIAGVLGYLSPVVNTSLNQLNTVMRVNFESNFLLTQLCTPFY